jgi:putative pyruvate formate lyase activating enzyme
MVHKIVLIRKRLKDAFNLLESCRVCPRRCGVNRLKGKTGICGVGFLPSVASDNLHFGEEPPISGKQGSGTVFLSGCSLGCSFCQNYPISQLGHGQPVSFPRLAGMMLRLQSMGAHNINFVTPTHVGPQILAALLIAIRKGLRIPLVYNSGGYESLDMLKLFDGIIDIYLPDMKYADPAMAAVYSQAPDYPDVNRAAILEMHRQVGPLRMDDDGIAVRGLVIRHLVLPDGIAGTDSILRFIAESVSREIPVSLMRQYFPAHRAAGLPVVNRRVTPQEYAHAKSICRKFGLVNGWMQE